MTITTMRELFKHELRDVYYAETNLLRALRALADETKWEELSDAFREHAQETQTHVERIEKVFALLGENARALTCAGVQGLIEEHRAFVNESPTTEINDLYNVVAGIKAERYEISAYEGLIHLAREHLGLDEAAELLEDTLLEEEAALERLHGLLEAHGDAARIEESAA